MLAVVGQAAAEARRKTELSFGNFYNLLHNVRTANAEVEDSRSRYLTDLSDLRRLRRDYFTVMEHALGPQAVSEKIAAEQAADVARASAPTLRVPGAENEQFRSEMRSALARSLSRQITADGLPLYDINKELERRGMSPMDYDTEETVREGVRGQFGRRPAYGEKPGPETRRPITAPPAGAVPTLVRLTPAEMERAAASQGALRRPRPPSGASAFASAERERTGRQIGANDYAIPDKVLGHYVPGRKVIVLWMSPTGDHIIRVANQSRTAQFHQLGDVGLDGVFHGETWADVLSKALHHQVLFLTEAAMLGKADAWDVWIGKSGWPLLYRVYSGREKKPLTVQTAFDRLRTFGLDTAPQGDPLSVISAPPPSLNADIAQWTEQDPTADPNAPLDVRWSELAADATEYQNALARVFMKESVAPQAGLSLLREASRKQMREESMAASAVEMSEDVPTPLVFIPPDTYTDEGICKNDANDGQRLVDLLKGALAAAEAGAKRIRIVDAALLGANTSTMDKTVARGPGNQLTLPSAEVPGGGVKSNRFPSPLLAAAELASRNGEDITIELALPQAIAVEYAVQIDERLGGDGGSNIGAHVQVKVVPLAAKWDTALAQMLKGRFNRVLLFNSPDSEVTGTVGSNVPHGMFGNVNISKNVMTSISGNLGQIAGIGIATDSSVRVQLVRGTFNKLLDKKIAQLYQQGSTAENVPIAGFTADKLDSMGIKSGELTLADPPTRTQVVEAVKNYLVKQAGLSAWDKFITMFPGGPLENPRRNPFARKNYDRRMREEMASRYMRQQPWMFPTR